MNCLNCNAKSCKSQAKDCNDGKENALAAYSKDGFSPLYANADKLVSDGRAGTLSRIDEIAEFAKEQGYKEIGLAYCFGIEDLSKAAADFFKRKGLKVSSYRCTLNGIKAPEINDSLNGGVNCNPAGQAQALNEGSAELIVEMGLCLGHDIIFHQILKKPFTVLIVKDRVHNHDPKQALLQ